MMTVDDPYAVLAAEQMTSPAKARLRAAKTREEHRQAQAQCDQEILATQWRKWHDRQIKQLKSGRYAKAIREVTGFLETMTLEDGGRLIDLVLRGPWREADADTCYLLISLIDARIILLRRTEGWPPFDDSIPLSDEPPTAFEIIRRELQTWQT